MEIWKDIPMYEGKYQVSNMGRVKSLNRTSPRGNHTLTIKGGILSPTKVGKRCNQYLAVNLVQHAQYKTFKVHRLVAMSFLDNHRNCEQINHKDGNKLNNALDNLEWCTRSENLLHAYRTGLIDLSKRRQNNKTKNVIDQSTGIVYKSMKEAAEHLNVNKRTLHTWLLGTRTNKSTMLFYE